MRQLNRIIKNNYYDDNEAELISGGEFFFKKLETIINEAQHTIYFQTYILEEDETGKQIQEALICAVQRNVKVFLLVDAYGSASLSKKFIEEMISSGIAFRFYGKLFSSWSLHIGRRLHHKVVVADGFHALVGGINIANKYNDICNRNAWLDFAVACKGSASQKIHLICMRKWRRKRIRLIPLQEKNLFLLQNLNFQNNCFVSVRENDSLLNKHQVSESYNMAFKFAEKEIVIAGGYFIPGFSFRNKIAKATRRGVRVRIITGAKSDIIISKYARQYLYAWMMRNGIEIYEYRKSMVHAKVAVVDKQWATVGSYDLNNLSASGNIEMNLDILNDAFAKKFHNILVKIISDDCNLISSKDLDKKNTVMEKLKMWFSYRIVRLLFWFSEVLVSSRKK